MNDDQKSPQQKKKKENKDAEQRLYHDVLAHSKLLKAIGEERDKEIISLISCYTPVLRDCPDQAIEMMTKISSGWTNRKEKLIKAINYVKYGEKKKLENENVELLSEILITEILNRMSSYCN